MEQVFIDVIHASIVAAWALQMEWAPVTVWVEDVFNTRYEWAELAPLIWLGCCETHSPHGSTVEAADIGEISLSPCVPAGDLHGCLDCLGSTVSVEDLLRALHGQDLAQFFSEVNIVVVEEVGIAVVDELVNLILDSLLELGVSVSHAAHCETRVHVDELVSIDVFYDVSFSALNYKRVGSTETR